MNGVPPQVIRRGDEYVLLNVPYLHSLTKNQRMILAIEVWDQVKTMMEANGEKAYYLDVDKRAAAMLGVAYTSLARVREMLTKRPELRDLFEAGMSLADLERTSGRVVTSRLEEGVKSRSQLKNSYYGKSDKFEYAIEPLLRYLKAWEKKGFEFRHINPSTARRRLKKIRQAQNLLARASEDLGRRSQVATSRAPSEKRRENSS